MLKPAILDCLLESLVEAVAIVGSGLQDAGTSSVEGVVYMQLKVA